MFDIAYIISNCDYEYSCDRKIIEKLFYNEDKGLLT